MAYEELYVVAHTSNPSSWVSEKEEPSVWDLSGPQSETMSQKTIYYVEYRGIYTICLHKKRKFYDVYVCIEIQKILQCFAK